jgi:hypothetical protein
MENILEFQKSVIELIKERKSSRTYDEKMIDPTSLQKLKYVTEKVTIDSPIKARFFIVNRKDGGETPKKLGTYGIISGANTFLVGVINSEEKDIQGFGYLFEKIILFATDLGLQTCWLGGTFKKSDFNNTSKLSEQEYIAMVSPIGYKKEKQRLLETAMRAFAGSNTRKSWSELFFNHSMNAPLTEENAGTYAIPLEMVRLAPSASNKQPWRIIKDNLGFHFFLCRTKGYWATTFDMQKNDIGIARLHFEETSRELGLEGKWQSTEFISTPKDCEYMKSWLF